MLANVEDLALLERVLAPFETDQSAGPDLRLDPSPRSAYSRLRDARAEARAEERASDNDVSAESRTPPGWSVVETLALEILTERSKDIEIACWLAESLVRRRSLAGLALAAAILAGLVERYWHMGLNPPAEPDDPEARLFAISGLSGAERDGSLMQPLRKTVLFEASDGTPIAFWAYERATSIAALPEPARRQQLEKGRVPAFDAIEVAARGAGREALAATARAMHEAQAAWSELETRLAEVEPNASVSTGRVAALLVAIRRIASLYVPEAEWVPPAPSTAMSEADVATSGIGQAEATSGGEAPPTLNPRTRTRDELLDEILRIAVVFRENEPNAPIGYTLEEAVRRARLPLHDLLREILPELPSRSNVLTILGIRPPAE